MYKDGWWLSQMMPRIPWELDPETLKQFAPGVWDPDDDPVELYYLPDDFSQANEPRRRAPGEGRRSSRSCSGRRPRRYHVLPLLGGLTVFFGIVPPLADADRSSPTTATCRTSPPG